MITKNGVEVLKIPLMRIWKQDYLPSLYSNPVLSVGNRCSINMNIVNLRK